MPTARLLPILPLLLLASRAWGQDAPEVMVEGGSLQLSVPAGKSIDFVVGGASIGSAASMAEAARVASDTAASLGDLDGDVKKLQETSLTADEKQGLMDGT